LGQVMIVILVDVPNINQGLQRLKIQIQPRRANQA